MKSYISQVSTINRNSFNNRNFSLSGKDYRQLKVSKNNKPLSGYIKKSYQGKEIGSASYMKHSKYRFLKTTNLTDSFGLSEESIEYCRPENIAHPQFGDILIAKDGGGEGLGESAIYNLENRDKTDSVSAGVLGMRVSGEDRYYLLGLIKSQHFKNFVDLNTPQGSTIRHSKKVSLLYPVPLPQNSEIQKLISIITQNILDKEGQIKLKNKKIDELIENELKENQKSNTFEYQLPRIFELKKELRVDTGLYEQEFKKNDFLISNYCDGYQNIFDLGFTVSRGQNLQISSIGLSIYSEDKKDNFYTLILSKYFKNRVFEKVSYLGSGRKLKTIKKGDIIFSCRGEMGRSVIFPEQPSKMITNIDNVHISSKSSSLNEKIYLFCFFGYLKKVNILDSIACTGSGAPSFTQYQFEKLKIPNFPNLRQKEIVKEYYNPIEKNSELNFENYLEKERVRNTEAGIFQLNMELFSLREKLEDLVDKIVREERIDISLKY